MELARGGLMALAIAGCSGPSLSEWEQVDRLEGEKAVLVREGVERRVERAGLPPDLREGDVLVRGRKDPSARRRLEARVRSARDQATKAQGGSFELGDPSPPRLTLEVKR